MTMKKKYVDSIRGLAILMVILVHTSQRVEGLSYIVRVLADYGQMGVQLFFVASAYTLCLSAQNRITESNPRMKYAIRRFFRIAPGYYVAMIGYFVISFLEVRLRTGMIYIPEKYTLTSVLSNLFFFHGFYSPGNSNLVPGGWSIGTEMAFYVVFPFLLLFAKKVQLVNLKNIFIWIFTILIFSQISIFLISSYSDYEMGNNSFLYFNLINQLSVFSLGIALYFLESNKLIDINWKLDLF